MGKLTSWKVSKLASSKGQEPRAKSQEGRAPQPRRSGLQLDVPLRRSGFQPDDPWLRPVLPAQPDARRSKISPDSVLERPPKAEETISPAGMIGSLRSQNWIAPLSVLIAALTVGAVLARGFAVMTPENYAACAAQGWTLSPPVWKPDSTAVLCDKPGNVDFTSAERLTLDSLDAVIIGADTVAAWMQMDGWIQEVEE